MSYNTENCKAILCTTMEESIRLQSLALLHGVFGGASANVFICNTDDIGRIESFYDIEYIASVEDVLKWTNEGKRDWWGE